MGEELSESLPALNSTEIVCADCGESVHYMDEVYLLQIVKPFRLGTQRHDYPVFDEEDTAGAFRFAPWFFCVACWDKLFDSIRSDMSDELPVVDDYSDLECACCASGIRCGNAQHEGELAGTVTMGEPHVAERSPSGERAADFVPISNPDTLCLYCLVLINNGYIDMWPDLSEHGECADCIQMRCWRERQCACECHLDLPEEEEEEEEQPVAPHTFT